MDVLQLPLAVEISRLRRLKDARYAAECSAVRRLSRLKTGSLTSMLGSANLNG